MGPVVTQINVLNSKISLLIQRLTKLEGDFQVISRTVIAHNSALKELEDKLVTSGAPETSSEEESESASPFSRSSASSSNLDEIRKEIEQIKVELTEMKYVVDSVNPVAYVTIDEVSDLIDEKLREKKRK